MSAVDALLASHRLVVCVGPGGVGKTTFAAALAARGAAQGRRALVLTIDPARRLADALGLEGETGDAAHRVETGTEGAGTLDAAMLDTRAAWDELLERIVPDVTQRERIRDNRVYGAFSRTLARSHAYIATERLHAALGTREHDLIVLDTPPMRSALEILDAPGHLVRFLDDGVVRRFLHWRKRAAGARGLQPGAAALDVLASVTGASLIHEMVTFFRLFAAMRDGFSERAGAVQRAFTEPTTAFVLVASPRSTHLDDARYLRDGLLEREVGVDAVVFNRAFVAEPGEPARPVRTRMPEPADLDHATGELLLVLADHRASVARRNETQTARAARFVEPLGVDPILVPELDEEPASVEALVGLATLAG